MTIEELAHALSLLTSGTVAGFIIYTTKNGRTVIYPKPDLPPSNTPAQLQVRDRFKRAQAAWAALSPAGKRHLERACQILSLPLSGQNLYIRLALQTNQGKRLTMIRQTGLPLPAIPFVPYLP